MNWFVRRGIFFVPVSLGWLLLGITAAYLVWAFPDIDGRSHSVSDTLINWVFNVLIVGMLYSVIGYCTERKVARQ